MRQILAVLSAAAVSLVLYVGVFGFVIKKPLTIGFMYDALTIKQSYAARAEGPKVVVVSGSAGLFSVSCAVMEHTLARPCVNGAITAELGLEYILEIARRLLQPGDTVVMPLEYNLYRGSAEVFRRQDAHPFRVTYDRQSLWDKPRETVIRAFLQFDLRYLIGAVVENVLAASGVSRRFNRDTLTPNGDMRDHTAEKGNAFRDVIDRDAFWLPRADEFRIVDEARKAITDFNVWAQGQAIRVFGTLPTTFDDRPVETDLMERIAALFRDGGQRFLALANRGQYPRSCFYDTQYHLNETCQGTHSRLLAEALIPLL